MAVARGRAPHAYHPTTDLSAKLAPLKERIEIRQAQHEGALDRLRADMAARDTEAAKRETRMLLAMAGMIGLAVAVLKF